jgi:hypothetical protein
MISKSSSDGVARVVYFLDFTPFTFSPVVYQLSQTLPVVTLEIAFVDILISWFYLGYSLKGKTLNEAHI